MVTWFCLGFLFALVSCNLDILGVKFDSRLTFEDNVRGIVSRVSHRIGSTLQRRDFEVSSPEVSTRIFILVGVLAVSGSPGIIRCGFCLHIAPMDTTMKQALL